ncbi:MAG TPA: Gfo/Idh/MocA family oxidoreductase, partial [Puia sp.]
MRVRLKSSYLVREPLPTYSIFGHKGTFLKTRGDLQEKHLLAGGMPEGENWGIEADSDRGLLHTEIDGKVIRELVPSEKGDAGDYFRGIYQAIRNNKPLPVTAEEGALVIRVIEKAYESLAAKKIVAFR